MELFTDVVRQYVSFADYAAGESACFEEWARGVAEDPEVVDWVADLPPVKQQPNLVFAAARWHGVPAPGPYAGLRTALLADDGPIRATILARSTQTNEVGRLATLTPVFARIQAAGTGPIALLEAGASAGLVLYPDRYDYRWVHDDGRVESWPVGSSGNRTVLRCRVSGPFARPEPEGLEVAWRGGLDLNPLDVVDEEQMRWLEVLVWPEDDERRDRLRHAIAVARQEPPVLTRGDLLTDLPDLVTDAAGHGRVVVFHSAVAAYLEPDDRERFHDLMVGLVEAGACHWVSNEGHQVLPRVSATLPEVDSAPSGDGTPFVLGLDGVAIGRTHGHGAALRWL